MKTTEDYYKDLTKLNTNKNYKIRKVDLNYLFDLFSGTSGEKSVIIKEISTDDEVFYSESNIKNEEISKESVNAILFNLFELSIKEFSLLDKECLIIEDEQFLKVYAFSEEQQIVSILEVKKSDSPTIINKSFLFQWIFLVLFIFLMIFFAINKFFLN